MTEAWPSSLTAAVSLAGFPDPMSGIWDLETGQQLQRIFAFGASLAISTDGRRALIGGGNLIRLWDLETDEEIIREQYKQAVLHVAFSPESRQAVSSTEPSISVGQRSAHASRDPSVQVWALPPGRRPGEFSPVVEVAQFIGPHGIINTAVVSPDGQRLLTAGWPNTIRLWNRETIRLIRQFDERARNTIRCILVRWKPSSFPAADDGVVRLLEPRIEGSYTRVPRARE